MKFEIDDGLLKSIFLISSPFDSFGLLIKLQAENGRSERGTLTIVSELDFFLAFDSFFFGAIFDKSFFFVDD